jgi:hypothetical protein
MPLRDAEVWLTIAESEQLRGNLSLAIEYYKLKTLEIVSYPPLRRRIFTAMGPAYRGMGDEISAQQCFAEAAHQRTPFDWQGDWWRQLAPMLRDRLRKWRSGFSRSPSQ